MFKGFCDSDVEDMDELRNEEDLINMIEKMKLSNKKKEKDFKCPEKDKNKFLKLNKDLKNKLYCFITTNRTTNDYNSSLLRDYNERRENLDKENIPNPKNFNSDPLYYNLEYEFVEPTEVNFDQNFDYYIKYILIEEYDPFSLNYLIHPDIKLIDKYFKRGEIKELKSMLYKRLLEMENNNKVPKEYFEVPNSIKILKERNINFIL